MSKFEIKKLEAHICAQYSKNTYYDKKRHFTGFLPDSFSNPYGNYNSISKIPITHSLSRVYVFRKSGLLFVFLVIY